jgi:hypothetical protein
MGPTNQFHLSLDPIPEGEAPSPFDRVKLTIIPMLPWGEVAIYVAVGLRNVVVYVTLTPLGATKAQWYRLNIAEESNGGI